MWCDNCCLIFPLRHGALAWAAFVGAYSLAGAILLFIYGPYFWFLFPEAQIYGGISIAVLVLCLGAGLGISNNSLVWLKMAFWLWPIVIITCAVRAGLMLFRLDYYQSRVIWECDHGGMLWNATYANESVSAISGTGSPSSASKLPSTFCNAGFHNFYLAFAFALVIDWLCQSYMYFLTWRCVARVYHYIGFKRSSAGGGYYGNGYV